LEPYACGQRDVENYVNPDYSEFFSYAFIFTVVHILILVVATAPRDVSLLPVIYIVSGFLAILIAFKR
jgi:NADH:ubiquinone oxidoreductase subunit 3 (subunit A)